MQFESRAVDHVRILKISGDFQGKDTTHVRRWLDMTIHEDCPNIIINMEEVLSIDSQALSILLFGLKEAKKMQGNLFLCGLQQKVRILFEMTRMSQVFVILPREQDALKEFHG